MRIYDIAFYACGFFLVGVLLYSLKLSVELIALIAAFSAILFLLVGYLIEKNHRPKIFWLAGLTIIIFFGAFYAALYDFVQAERVNIAFDKKINFSGLVADYPQYGSVQSLKLSLQPPYAGNILIKLPPHPEFHYGDLIGLEAVIKRPAPAAYADYLRKERIFGTVNAFRADLLSQNNGSIWKAKLFELRKGIISSFQKILPAENAAFLAGLTLGEQAEFSKELKEAMKNSGTTHLVALSGYNISIIAWTIGTLFSWFLSRRLSFALSIFVIIGFVLMTGAQASVVRAAIMGVILLVANQVGRIFSVRNAIIIAAFLMILINPRVLRFDVGFQLSFLALLGIVYVAPTIQKFFGMEDTDLLSLKSNFFQTLGAQLAVAPILILSFGQFSPISLLTNVLILPFIPLTMAIGFIIGAVGFLSWSLSFILGWSANVLLSYELFIIKFFGGLNILRINSMGIASALVYYFVLVGAVIFMKLKTRAIKEQL